ncbi:unnamed protein product [Durusdinium trenchii]|uniref:Uncharacterized protein n=1 Tax=Durusdinium trenchii TaxID=1381693 RepID=A0ABP0MZV5_9DINO
MAIDAWPLWCGRSGHGRRFGVWFLAISDHDDHSTSQDELVTPRGTGIVFASAFGEQLVRVDGHVTRDGARSLLWNAVCKNIKERLVNGLAADGWRVDVFLFLSLRDDARPGRVARNYRPEQMAYCQKLLMPVHSEWMESVYVPPPHGCAKGQEPGYTRKVKKKEKDRAASLRVFSQCKRLEIAYDFIETYEQTAPFMYGMSQLELSEWVAFKECDKRIRLQPKHSCCNGLTRSSRVSKNMCAQGVERTTMERKHRNRR